MGDATDSSWVDSSVLAEIESVFSTTFSSEKESNLQLKRLRGPEDDVSTSVVLPYLWTKDIYNEADLDNFSASPS